MFISKGFLKHKQVKISDKKERRFRDMVTLFSSSNATINYQEIRSEYLPLVKQCEKISPVIFCLALCSYKHMHALRTYIKLRSPPLPHPQRIYCRSKYGTDLSRDAPKGSLLSPNIRRETLNTAARTRSVSSRGENG